jgi:nicotinamide-nucleotide amidase
MMKSIEHEISFYLRKYTVGGFLMKAEIISIGTELLLGQVTNTNAAFLSRELALLGIELYHQTTVGDNPKRLQEAIKTAESRADIIVLTGGLGPTKDDITKKTVADYLKTDLVLHEESEDKIITFHKNSNFQMPENNQLQALILKESIAIPNDNGLAAGMFLEKGDHVYILLPGPPDELETMFENHLKEMLVEHVLEEEVLVSRVLRFFGLTESQLAEKLDDLIEKQDNPTIAIYAESGELTVRLTAKEESEEKCEKLIDELEDKIKAEVEEYFFGYGEKRLSDVIKDLLIEQGKTITAAESLTGGAFLSSISSDLAAGSIFEGGIVTYSAEKKNKALGVMKKTIETYGVVSPECAIEMAEKVKKMFDADIGVSLTGAAGPSALEGNIPGTVWIGIAHGEESFAKRFHFAYKRNRNRHLAVLNALDMVRRVLMELPIEEKAGYGEDKQDEEGENEKGNLS